MEYDVKQEGDVWVVNVPRNGVTFDAAEDFEAGIAALLNSGKNRLVLNLGEVDFIDSRGLGVLLTLHSRAKQDGGLVLCCLAEKVGQVMALTQMDRILTVYKSLEEAVLALSE